MENAKQKTVLTLFLLGWTAFVLYGSLAPGEELPPTGWLAWIPYLDKWVHFGFYFGEVLLLLLRFNPQRRLHRIVLTAGIILFSGLIECVQPAVGRTADLLDLLTNSLGAVAALLLAAPLYRLLIAKRILS